MNQELLVKISKIVNGFVDNEYNNSEQEIIKNNIKHILNVEYYAENDSCTVYQYDEMQILLSSVNEKEKVRKSSGVYYTSDDVVNFILISTVKNLYGLLEPSSIKSLNIDDIPIDDFCYKKHIFDPTCGTGAFLYQSLLLKLELLNNKYGSIDKTDLTKVLKTLHGNDINKESISICKLRLYLCAIKYCDIKDTVNIYKVLNNLFTSCDFIENGSSKFKYDIVIGNPPYVEDSKSNSKIEKKYGNIYANVLENSANALKKNGVFGFIVPLSYISTPRMEKIRKTLLTILPVQYILNYSDRPDCLFPCVHQKLCIILARKCKSEQKIYTSNYQYWYKNERINLFAKSEVIENNRFERGYIPKLGNINDLNVFKKVTSQKSDLNSILSANGDFDLYLNMRAAFWIKAFINVHIGSEYKKFKCENMDIRNFCFCLLNSSLFWWYWTCVSDCWHITNKDLKSFKVPKNIEYSKFNKLAQNLEQKLETTKKYVGTKQTEYEYKHKECIAEISEIDDEINKIFNLSKEESGYIKAFAYKYRIGDNK